ncbi:TPA: SIS domain-containing protein [Serratia odorifera]|uniref:SIS domain-containing protein n=1 Tax=Serratia odorifera TaxID=618 RepID=UPI0029DF6804|nr:SIS domain-containing protein [Serratia odorifera]
MYQQPTAACWTEREIRQQPEVWLATVDAIERQRQALESFLTPLLAHPGLRVILTGAGSSAFIGDTLAPMLARTLNAPVQSVSTTDIVSDPAGFLPADRPLLLVSFARSGSSPESLAAVALANQHNADSHHLLITCNAEGDLYRRHHDQPRVLALALPANTCDRGFAMTSSMSSMILACLCAFNVAGIDPVAVQALAQSVAALLEATRDVTRSPLQTADAQRVIWLGSGALRGIAHESALKLLELTAGQTAAFYESPLGFRHGPKSLINRQTQVIVLMSNDPYTRRYDEDLLNELRNDGVACRIVALAGRPSAEIERGEHIYLPNAQGFNDGQLALGLLVFAQLYALAQSVHFGMTPDNPSPEGRVNRVVQGVTIYPWHAQP